MKDLPKKYFYFAIAVSLVLIVTSTITWKNNKMRFGKVSEAIKVTNEISSLTKSIEDGIENKESILNAFANTGAIGLEESIHKITVVVNNQFAQLTSMTKNNPQVAEKISKLTVLINNETKFEKSVIEKRKQSGKQAVEKMIAKARNDGTFYSSAVVLTDLGSYYRKELNALSEQSQRHIDTGNNIFYGVAISGLLLLVLFSYYFLNDLSERKKTELLLQQNKEQLQTIVDNHYAPIFAKYLDGKYFLWNNSCEEIMNYR